MANTHTTIVEWVALVRQYAINLRQVGGQADDDAELSVLVSGLLPEFQEMRLILDQTENLTLQAAVRRLTNHARANNLLHLAKGKGNSSQPNAKVFNSVAMTAECSQWLSKEGCSYGKHCKFAHTDPKGKLAKVTNLPRGDGRRRFQKNQRLQDRPANTSFQAGSSKEVPPPGAKTEGEEPASTFTAQEATTAAVYSMAAQGQQEKKSSTPTVCYICFSHDHDTSQCELRHDESQTATVMMADDAAPDQPSKYGITAQWPLFTLLAGALLAVVLGGVGLMKKAFTIVPLREVTALVLLVCALVVMRVDAAHTPLATG